MQVQRPHGNDEFRHRAEEARSWAGRYASYGWQVTPSCNGRRGQAPDGLSLPPFPCPLQDLHPEDSHRWEKEATTNPYALDVLWAERAAYGVIARGGGTAVIASVVVDGLTCDEVNERLAGVGIIAPVLRTATVREFRVIGERATVLISNAPQPQPLPQVHGVTVQEWPHPVPLPGAAAGGHVEWAQEPAPEIPLPQAAAVMVALRPPPRP
ncbi:bifunctional DNA primase/polymerase [Streptomyces fildesensis]|nr:bifunctional DNA primase/polymerase [Streptomyces fildesensis]